MSEYVNDEGRRVTYILSGELLGLLDHAVNLLLRETSLLIGDGDLLRLATGEG